MWNNTTSEKPKRCFPGFLCCSAKSTPSSPRTFYQANDPKYCVAKAGVDGTTQTVQNRYGPVWRRPPFAPGREIAPLPWEHRRKKCANVHAPSWFQFAARKFSILSLNCREIHDSVMLRAG